MKILIVSATEAEISPFLAHLSTNEALKSSVEVLVTGVGMVATTYQLTRQLAKNKYDLAIQAGVGGAFSRAIELGEVVEVTTERFGDIGAEDNGNYLDMFTDIPLIDPNVFPFSEALLHANHPAEMVSLGLRQVSGLTVNTVSGTEAAVAMRVQRFGCDVESMEGAAFFYVCKQENTPMLQMRAISNYVEPRNRASWKMKEAVIALNAMLIETVNKISGLGS